MFSFILHITSLSFKAFKLIKVNGVPTETREEARVCKKIQRFFNLFSKSGEGKGGSPVEKSLK
jgi:hypothetical protein